ncbi:RNA polymerase II transcriptional coactivator KELP-like isoform X1 [Cucurbita maxima]|uniref:RNA polymerase II transcriptional coactivator KELP-like isoform X1 n=1 Tax=Cucurbita maxima TaxID=3661 RepID=A0A6J1J851_CUCMA|nr:RNA polymerase II transcriptional coactivator KELP-like isoform X1 [Cucurbita maxima]XP_022985427.1 RNA polymerase II transcriptional coactivator KELP-like isoform X1 [Cucurbita maxima]
MDSKIQRRIEEAVRRILESSDMDEMTESKIRALASKDLDLDLSKSPYKALVRKVVESFLQKRSEDQLQEEAEDASADQLQEEAEDASADQLQEEAEDASAAKEKEYDDDGDLIVCWLSSKRKVTIQDFRGKTLVSIREFYRKDGKDLPTAKGISLTEEQWSVFKNNVPAIEKAIKNMQSQIM